MEDNHKGERADLSYARLEFVDLQFETLSYANFKGVCLVGKNLRYSNLGGADLSYTNLEKANLKDANLYNANLKGATMDFDTMSNGCDYSTIDFDDDQLKRIAQFLINSGLRSKNASEEAKIELQKLETFVKGE